MPIRETVSFTGSTGGASDMSEQRTNVVGIVFVTMCVTACVMVGGWFAAKNYLGQPVDDTPVEEARAAPAPRRTAPRAAAPLNSNTALPDAGSPGGTAPAPAREAANRSIAT